MKHIIKHISITIIAALLFTTTGCTTSNTASSTYSSIPEITITSEEISTENIFMTTEETSSDSTSNTSTTPQTSTSTTPQQNNVSSENLPSGNSNNSNGPKFVQLADPKTGISWDGVSPILYTYPDGTTGYDIKLNATYEAAPGWTCTIENWDLPDGMRLDYVGRIDGSICEICGKQISTESKGIYCAQKTHPEYCSYCGEYVNAYQCHTCKTVWVSLPYYCNHCGKPEGNGLKGTCARWLMSDVNCPNCGVRVAVHTCHSCSGACTRCGKTLGDGTNGTCYRVSEFSVGEICSFCGVNISKNSCHTCN